MGFVLFGERAAVQEGFVKLHALLWFLSGVTYLMDLPLVSGMV